MRREIILSFKIEVAGIVFKLAIANRESVNDEKKSCSTWVTNDSGIYYNSKQFLGQ